MEVVKCEEKFKCDFYGCKNLAEYSFKTQKFMAGKMHFCKTCINELYASLGKIVVPKQPQTPFKEKLVKSK